MKESSVKRKLTFVSIFHYIRLCYRGALFLTALVIYVIGKLHGQDMLTTSLEQKPVIVRILWLVFTVDMLMRFFPSRLESPGCQKQFRRNYRKSGEINIEIQDNNATMLVALIWICFNLVFGCLHLVGVLDEGFMLLLCCAYSVCDMICILFFCPFQTWFLKNKCCSTCRIYNWDFAMMFTPLFFIQNAFTWGLLAQSLVLMIRWEITFYRHPERFSEKTNEYLRCANCTEKLCAHKKQLHSLWKQVAEFYEKRTRFLRKEQ